MEKNPFERGKLRFQFPLISCEDKNKEKKSLFEVGEFEKSQKSNQVCFLQIMVRFL